ncbi:MAG: hypothetical protein ACYC90_05095 [Candidatus Nanopelagicales bacterium]
MPPDITDPDLPDSWPPNVDDYVRREAPAFEFDSGMLGGPASDWLFTQLDRPVRAYHCTRLLAHEDDVIRERGLEVLTPTSLSRRVDAVLAAEEVTEVEADLLHAASIFRGEYSGTREGLVHAFASTCALESDSSLNYFLGEWGGEAIRRSKAGMALPDHLVRLGRPSVVVLALDLSNPDEYNNRWSGLLRTFIATLRDPDRRGARIVLKRSVTPFEIADIWHPGDSAYDRFPNLKRN